MSAECIISVRGVRRTYRLESETVNALDGVSLDIAAGEYLSLMGPSGSGKSTLFNMIGGLDQPDAGEVLIEGKRLDTMNQRQLAYVRCRRIGFIFQTFNLIGVLSALDNVMLPLTFAGIDDAAAAARAREILDQVGLSGRHDHLPGELSGGQQQRVAIARALANRPTILLADEPTGNLDLKTGEEVIALLGKLSKEYGVTIISATHDHKMLAASDRVVYLEDGKIIDIKNRDQIDIQLGTIGGQAGG